jgi:hypothetical protein
MKEVLYSKLIEPRSWRRSPEKAKMPDRHYDDAPLFHFSLNVIMTMMSFFSAGYRHHDE